MKKTSVLAFIVALAMLLMTGCGGKSEAPTAVSQSAEVSAQPTEADPSIDAQPEASPLDTQPAESPEAPAEPEPLADVALPVCDKPIEVSLWQGLRPTATAFVESGDDLYLYGAIGELSNVNFNLTLCSAFTESENFNLLIAAGEYTDIISGMSMYSSGITGALDDEVIIDLYDYVTEFAPHYWEKVNGSVEARTTLVNQEGKMGTMSAFYKEAGMESNGLIVRGDWLDEFGIESVVTYDELANYLRLAKDEKGVTMTIPSTGEYPQLSQGFGVIAGYFSTYNDTVKHYAETEGFYDYLSLMADWYSQGLIDADFISRAGTTSLGDLFITNQSSMGEAYASAMVGLNTIAADPEAVFVGIPSPRRSPEEEYTIGRPVSQLNDSDIWAITCDCDEEKIPSLMKLADYMFTEEGELLYNYGVEGVTFDFDEAGKPQYTDLVVKNPDGLNYSAAETIYVTVNIPGIRDISRSFYNLTDVGWEALELFMSQENGMNTLPYNIDSFLTTEEAQAYAEVSSDVDTYLEDAVLKFITGAERINSESFSKFVEECVAMGMDKMDAFYQTAYDRYLESTK